MTPCCTLWQVVMNLDHPQADRESQDMHQLHRTLSRLIWQDEDDNDLRGRKLEEARVLFRADPGGLLWVSAQRAVHWRRLPPGWLAYEPEGWLIDQAPPEGEKFLFVLTCRPSRKCGSARHDLVDEKEQSAWLMEQGEKRGFRPDQVSMTQVRWIDTRDRAYAERPAVRFEGVLTCTEGPALLEALVNGVGPGKAQGFGLLTLIEQKPWGRRLVMS